MKIQIVKLVAGRTIHACKRLSPTHLIIAGLVAIEGFCHEVLGFHAGLENLIQYLCMCECHLERLEK